LGLCFCPCDTSRFVGQALADGANNRNGGALLIVNPDLLPIGVAEIEFAKVTLQVSL
jgi:hypothetical protein